MRKHKKKIVFKQQFAINAYTRVNVGPLGIGISEQSSRSCTVGMELEVIELKFIAASIQSLGDVLTGSVLGDSGEDGMDHVACL